MEQCSSEEPNQSRAKSPSVSESPGAKVLVRSRVPPPELPSPAPPSYEELLESAIEEDAESRRVALGGEKFDEQRANFVRECALVRHRLKQANRFIFNPNSKRMQCWDVLMLGLLAYTATVTPFEVCMLTSDGQSTETTSIPERILAWVNGVVNAAFLGDMIVK